jgi:uncharacterized protein
LMEVIPSMKKIEFGRDKLMLGGTLSGFFGGLSGIQCALSSVFLIRSGLSKESFIATGIVIACIIDFSRLGVYSTRFLKSRLEENLSLVVAATLSAFAGVYVGSKLLKKVTFPTIQVIVTAMLIIIPRYWSWIYTDWKHLYSRLLKNNFSKTFWHVKVRRRSFDVIPGKKMGFR